MAEVSGPTRADTYRVTLTVHPPAGAPSVKIDGSWDQMEGGDVDSDELKYKPGGMEDEISLGGSRTASNVILRRLYRLQRDHSISQRWINWAGKARVTVTKQPLDTDGNSSPTIKPLVYNGKLKRVAFPNFDSGSNDAGLIELEITPEIPTGQ